MFSRTLVGLEAMSPAMSGRLPLLLFSSLQLLALAVIINSWGRSVKEEARSQAGWKQEVLDRGKDILWHVTSSCGYLSDRRLVVTSQRVVTPKGVVPAAGRSLLGLGRKCALAGHCIDDCSTFVDLV